MQCVIKIVAGPENGQEFRCQSGETVVGRSPRSAIRLASPSVSYEHAVISSSIDGFYLENLSANGTYLNNERLTGKTRLRARDQIRIGEETIARVESVPSTSGGGSSRVVLLGALVAILFIGLIIVVADPFSTSATRDYSRAHASLQTWVSSEVAAGNLPRELDRLFAEAWRLELAGDRKNAAKAWVRLRVYLASTPAGQRCQEFATQDRTALTRLLETPPTDPALPPATPEQMGAALVQFVSQMERQR